MLFNTHDMKSIRMQHCWVQKSTMVLFRFAIPQWEAHINIATYLFDIWQVIYSAPGILSRASDMSPGPTTARRRRDDSDTMLRVLSYN